MLVYRHCYIIPEHHLKCVVNHNRLFQNEEYTNISELFVFIIVQPVLVGCPSPDYEQLKLVTTLKLFPTEDMTLAFWPQSESHPKRLVVETKV